MLRLKGNTPFSGFTIATKCEALDACQLTNLFRVTRHGTLCLSRPVSVGGSKLFQPIEEGIGFRSKLHESIIQGI